MKKTIALVLALMLCITLFASCGGSGGDVLKGTWEGTYEDGNASWNFDGNGKCKLTTVFLDKEPGTYTIKNDTEVDVTINGWSDAITYTYKIDGDKLTLTANDPYSPNYDLKKK
jgi:predicted small secreted protein